MPYGAGFSTDEFRGDRCSMKAQLSTATAMTATTPPTHTHRCLRTLIVISILAESVAVRGLNERYGFGCVPGSGEIRRFPLLDRLQNPSTCDDDENLRWQSNVVRPSVTLCRAPIDSVWNDWRNP